MENHFELQTEEHKSLLVINVAGRIDSMNMKEFDGGLEREIQGFEGSAIVFDFEHLSYISSAGLRVILLLAETLHRKHVKLALCSLPASILDVIQTTGFDNIIDVYMSRSSAIGAVQQN